MEETKTPISEPCDEQGQPDCIETVQTDNAETGQSLDVDASEKGPMPESLNSGIASLVEQLGKQIEDISGDVKKCSEQLSQIVQQTDQLKAADSIIAELSTRCRTLSEQFYEREVLLPVIHCLISIADRARQQIAKTKTVRAKYADGQNESESKVLAYLVDGRNADLMELENALANLGVESYCHPQKTFEPSMQKCITRVESEEEILNGRIACHLLPGYKRDGRIIKKECVNVYIVKETIE